MPSENHTIYSSIDGYEVIPELSGDYTELQSQQPSKQTTHIDALPSLHSTKDYLELIN